MIVFYSWQSDLPNATNRGLIQRALEQAAKRIAADDSIEIEPVIDRDTIGKAGSPSIDETIFEKIAAADAYAADISIINQEHLALAARQLPPQEQNRLRPTPNPNVLLELGFAVRALGWHKIILIFNTATGDPRTDLPFDLRQKRRVEYRSAPEDPERATPRDQLAAVLDDAIREIGKANAPPPAAEPEDSPAVTVTKALESTSPARRARTRDFWSWASAQLESVEPNLREQATPAVHLQALKDALERSLPVVAAFSQVAGTVAQMDDIEAADEVDSIFGQILPRYDLPEVSSGFSEYWWFDFCRFIGDELFLIWIAHLIKEQRWATAASAFSNKFLWKKPETDPKDDVHSFERLSQGAWLLSLERKLTNRVSPQGDLLLHRAESSVGPRGLSPSEMQESDYHCLLADRVRNDSQDDRNRWTPWLSVYWIRKPRILIRSHSVRFAEGLAVAVGARGIANLKSAILASVDQTRELWGNHFPYLPIMETDVERIGTSA